MKPVETVLRKRGGVIKENDGKGKSKITVGTFVNVTMYPQYHYKMLIKKNFFIYIV
jgi:hypothetical protein